MRIKILSKRKCTHLHKKSISCRFSLNVITLFFFVTNWLGSFKNNLLLVNNVKTITTRFILRLPLSPLPTHPHTDTHNYKELHIISMMDISFSQIQCRISSSTFQIVIAFLSHSLRSFPYIALPYNLIVLFFLSNYSLIVSKK